MESKCTIGGHPRESMLAASNRQYDYVCTDRWEDTSTYAVATLGVRLSTALWGGLRGGRGQMLHKEV